MAEQAQASFLALPSLDRELGRALAILRLNMRRALDSCRAGNHEHRGRGRSQTFSEHRAYVPGDDLRHLDWRAFARRGRPHIKLFADEVRGTLEIVLDASASMGYGEDVGSSDAAASRGTLRKWDAARVLAYALAALALRQQDAVGLITWHDLATRALVPQAQPSQLRRILAVLANLRPQGQGLRAAAPALRLLHGRPSARRVVLISDFLRQEQACIEALGQLVRAGHQVCAVHLVHPDERELPFDGQVELMCLEGGASRRIDDQNQRQAFVQRTRAFDASLAAALSRAGVQLVRHNCAQDLGTSLSLLARGLAATR